ncbi:MAG: helix-turn-helix transcriptional regulator [Clostridia bacterium]|nr:helix-turn-helix transcriptional regulator [Clostridia bacterium]
MGDFDLKQIGRRICERRQTLGITQEKLAEQMDVSIQMVSNMERGNKAVKISNLIKLAEILDVSSDYILTGKFVAENKTVAEKISYLSDNDKNLVDALINRLIKDEN